MTDLQIRRLDFDFDGEIPFNWNPDNPAFSTYMDLVSIIAIAFETMVVAAVRQAIPLIDDPHVAEEADAFLRQEAQHSRAHRHHVRALIRQHPGLQQTLDEAIAAFGRVTATESLRYRLAYIADLEATFTPFFKMLLDNEDTLFKPGDDRVASLLIWHFVEEVEHRSSALIIYDAVVGSPTYRMRVLPRVCRHLQTVFTLIADGINEHVPLAERAIDTRSIAPLPIIVSSAKRRLGLLRDDDSRYAQPAFTHVPRRQKAGTVLRVLLSQTPFHNPAHEPLPELADRWFARHRNGDDVCHWYTTEADMTSGA